MTIDRKKMQKIMRVIDNGENAGFCIACGRKAHGIEPDAREYVCEHCGEPKVYGAEELLINFAPLGA